MDGGLNGNDVLMLIGSLVLCALLPLEYLALRYHKAGAAMAAAVLCLLSACLAAVPLVFLPVHRLIWREWWSELLVAPATALALSALIGACATACAYLNYRLSQRLATQERRGFEPPPPNRPA